MEAAEGGGSEEEKEEEDAEEERVDDDDEATDEGGDATTGREAVDNEAEETAAAAGGRRGGGAMTGEDWAMECFIKIAKKAMTAANCSCVHPAGKEEIGGEAFGLRRRAEKICVSDSNSAEEGIFKSARKAALTEGGKGGDKRDEPAKAGAANKEAAEERKFLSPARAPAPDMYEVEEESEADIIQG